MRIHLADSSNERGQYALLSECLFPNHLASFAYPRIFEYFEKSWDELVRIHLVSKPSSNSGLQTKALVEAEVKSHLLSFAFQGEEHPYSPIWSNAGLKPQSDPKSDLRPRVIVDSGAFTAWSTGKAIRPQDYAEWALKFDSRWRAKMASLEFMNLDVIGDQDATWKNLEILQGLGMRPLPVVTFGVDLAHLDRALEYPYISLGGLVPYTRNKPKLRAWLDACFARVMSHRNRTGKLCKVHLLGVTTDWVLRRYPCFSSDSSSWVACLRYGEGGSSGLKRLPRYKTSDAALAATLHTLRCEIRKFQIMQDTATKLWQSRGVTFDE